MSAPSKIYCIGDSITFGQELPSLAKAFPRLLVHALSCKVTTKGICGETTRAALERFHDVQDSGCDVAVIQYGHNDCNRWESDLGLNRVSPDAFRANLREMVGRCKRFGIRPIFMAPHQTLLGEEYEFDREVYAGIMYDTCDEVVSAILKEGMLVDAIHPNEHGHEVIADAIAKRIL